MRLFDSPRFNYDCLLYRSRSLQGRRLASPRFLNWGPFGSSFGIPDMGCLLKNTVASMAQEKILSAETHTNLRVIATC